MIKPWGKLMHWLTFPFWNLQERRLRAWLRIPLQLLLIGLVLSLFSIPVAWLGGDLLNLMQQIPALLMLSVVIAVWLAGRWLDHRPFGDYGFRLTPRWWLDFVFGLFLGAFLIVGIFLLELAAGWVAVTGVVSAPDGAFLSEIASLFGLFVSVAIQEELLARGYWLRNLAEGFNLRWVGARAALGLAYFLSSLVFGLLHLGNPNATWAGAFNVALAGLVLGLPYILTSQLAASIGLHLTWNFFMGCVFGFPVSGLGLPVSFVTVEMSGPRFWTGGAFGPEAGLVGVLALGVGALLILAWFYALDRRVAPRLELAQYFVEDKGSVIDGR